MLSSSAWRMVCLIGMVSSFAPGSVAFFLYFCAISSTVASSHCFDRFALPLLLVDGKTFSAFLAYISGPKHFSHLGNDSYRSLNERLALYQLSCTDKLDSSFV